MDTGSYQLVKTVPPTNPTIEEKYSLVTAILQTNLSGGPNPFRFSIITPVYFQGSAYFSINAPADFTPVNVRVRGYWLGDIDRRTSAVIEAEANMTWPAIQ